MFFAIVADVDTSPEHYLEISPSLNPILFGGFFICNGLENGFVDGLKQIIFCFEMLEFCFFKIFLLNHTDWFILLRFPDFGFYNTPIFL